MKLRQCLPYAALLLVLARVPAADVPGRQAMIHPTSPSEPMEVPAATVPAAPSALAAAPAPSAVSTSSVTVVTDQAIIDQHLAALANKIAQLESQLNQPQNQTQGRGALRRGTSFLVEGGGQESVLERLRRLETELTQARATLALRDSTLNELRSRGDREHQRAEGLSEKADSLGMVRDQLVAAQQTLAERQLVIDQLNQHMTETELARLQVERSYFMLAATVLRLVPGQGQDLVDVQEQVRQQAKILQPAGPSTPAPAAKESP